MLLCDASNKCYVLDYASKRSGCDVRTITDSELYAFSDVFDVSRKLLVDSKNALGK